MNTFSTSIEKPQNPYLLERVSNLVDVVAKNGLEFENMLKRKVPIYIFHTIAN